MFRVVGLYAAACWDVVLQAWLGKEANRGSEVVL